MTYHTSLTGLNAASFHLATTSHNIANTETTGFKRSRAVFENIFASTLQGSSPADAGQGVAARDPLQNFSQGALVSTANTLDLAVMGEGFFPIKSPLDGRDLYTREGGFRLNDNQYVVNGKGEFLQVAAVDTQGNALTGTLASLRIPPQTTGQFKPSTQITQVLQLPAGAKEISKAFDARDPQTYSHRTNVTLIDDAGNPRAGSLYYIKSRNADATDPFTEWKVVAEVDGQRITPQAREYRKNEAPARTSGTDFVEWAGRGEAADILTLQATDAPSTADGELSVVAGQLYRGDGRTAQRIGTLDAQKNGLNGQALRINLLPQAAPLNPASLDPMVSYSRLMKDEAGLIRVATDGRLLPELGKMGFAPSAGFSKAISLDLSDSRQANTGFALTRLEQDGRPEGRLVEFSVAKNGLVKASYSNGYEGPLGKILLAKFSNASGLDQQGDTRYAATTASGAPTFGVPGQGGLGGVQSGALEKSNVDMMGEMVELIMAQRNFQANAKAIETQSTMAQTMAENLR